MSGIEMVVLILAAALCVVLFMASAKRQRDESKPDPKRPTRRTIEVIELTVMPGAYFERWCDDCNRTHGWVNVYAYEGDDPSQARHIATAPVADDWGDQEGGRSV